MSKRVDALSRWHLKPRSFPLPGSRCHPSVFVHPGQSSTWGTSWFGRTQTNVCSNGGTFPPFYGVVHDRKSSPPRRVYINPRGDPQTRYVAEDWGSHHGWGGTSSEVAAAKKKKKNVSKVTKFDSQTCCLLRLEIKISDKRNISWKSGGKVAVNFYRSKQP